MDALIPIAAVAGVVGLVGVIWFASHQMEKKRTEAFTQTAQSLGLTFVVEPSEYPVTPGTWLFEQGRSRTVRNHASGNYQGVDLHLFDYSFVTGSGKNRTTHKQTVLHLASGSIDLPSFDLRPENILHKIGGLFGYQDIDFQMYPEFSKLFLLRGKDEAAIRTAFHNDVLQFFERRAGISVETSGGNSFVYYRHRTRIDPAQLRGFLDDGIALAQVLAA